MNKETREAYLNCYEHDLEVAEYEVRRIDRWIQEKRDFGHFPEYTYDQLSEERDDWQGEIDDLKDKIEGLEE